jgi:hypothetical protein
MRVKVLMLACLMLAAPAAQAAVTGHYATTTNSTITTSDTTATAAEIATFYGAPDDLYTGIGSHWVTYDLGNFRIIDGAGNDFNVYELNGGTPEWGALDILVSADNVSFFNVEASFGPAVDLIGDDAHGNASFRRSFNVGAAVTALGASQFRYLRLDGTSSGAISANNGFDLDAIGLVNFTEVTTPPGPGVVPEPASWAMMIAGFGLVGGAARRRRNDRQVSA